MSILNPETWTLLQSIVVFSLCALVIAIAGTRITRVVDQLADRTGLGEATAGAVLLGAATSLAGSVLSVTAAYRGHPELAVSNALGGIAVQTFFLAIADMVYRRANLEHAAASAPNMMQNGLLIGLLALILLAPTLPDATVWRIHPITPILIGFYLYGTRLIQGAWESPMWRPSITRDTREDKPEAMNRLPPLARLWTEFLLLMAILGAAGLVLEPAATTISTKAGLSQTIVGVLLTAVSTSIPELVTSVAAVRRGALTLAVGGIIGGNAFDTLFMAASDIAYREGSIYHTMTTDTERWVALTLVMAAILIMGLIRRERYGLGRIGAESLAIMVLYILGVGLMFGG
ncbi:MULTISPECIES: sodium:calcium antiporter [Halomonadaceae]|uniref:Sodium:calcium antiporter n=1 Tax=Vreelandella halophila TaxID=86177 RepID=A0A9X5B639_9GAMM|nr:sodium:calcium antiporter [Halomonas utahensis]MYL75635.1 sodium:calcium antiporter [Halomonas sp. 22501_18_FS]